MLAGSPRKSRPEAGASRHGLRPRGVRVCAGRTRREGAGEAGVACEQEPPAGVSRGEREGE